MNKYLILDCFVDEPACLGVPPFISPYPRYIAGALIEAGSEPQHITYRTIDSLRSNEYLIEGDYSYVFLIGGSSVPGKYLGARIGTLAEINRIIATNRRLPIAAGGVVSRALTPAPNLIIVMNDIEKFACSLARGIPEDTSRTYDDIDRWAPLGSFIINEHPWFPDIICEMETGRGCPRESHCTFCSEGLLERIEFREIKGIISETESLIRQGSTRFRIGRQPDIIQFGSSLSEFRKGFPRPEPGAVKELFSALKSFKDMGRIEVLNVDNANPGSIVNWPEESESILAAIASAVSAGDTLPFGIESFDENVVRMNNLKVNADEALFAIRMVNEICGGRVDGIPVLLPGVNLIQGLRGECSDTFKKNYESLLRMVDAGLMIKRINIRKLQPYPGTPLYTEGRRQSTSLEKRFEFFRGKIRDEIDNRMLKMIYPAGTIVRRNLMLDCRDGYSLGKQIASYSITVKIAGETGRIFQDILVTGHRERSLSGIPIPFNPNNAAGKAFEAIPGIGRERASSLILKRPFKTAGEFAAELDGVNNRLRAVIAENTLI